MAAQRQSYISFASCVDDRDKVGDQDKGSNFFKLLGRKRSRNKGGDDDADSEACATHCNAGACRLCVCCKHCPCEATPFFVGYVVLFVTLGVLVLIVLARHRIKRSAAIDKYKQDNQSRESSSFAAETSTVRPPIVSEQKPPIPVGSSNRDRAVVRRAIDDWHHHDLISNELREILLRTAGNRDTGASYWWAMFAILAFVVALFESGDKTVTVLHHLLTFSTDLFGIAPVLGKAIAMLLLASSTVTFGPVAPPTTTNVWRMDWQHLNWEIVRVFFFLAYIGAVVLSAVDTGNHAGETGGDGSAGSDLWYATVGSLGTICMVVAGCSAPRFFAAVNVWVLMTMMVLVLGCAASFRWILVAILSLVLIASSLVIRRTSLVSDDRYRERNWINHDIGILFLVWSTLHKEVSDLVPLSTGFLVVLYGAACDGSTYQAGFGTLGVCFGSASLIRKGMQSLYLPMNLPLVLAVVFTLATFGFGGWGWTPVIRLPSKTNNGITTALVGATMGLLLVAIVTGNTLSHDEWRNVMDFDADAFLPNIVDGGYAYKNRIFQLPWCIPIVLYYRVLYKFWPEMETRFRRVHVLRIATSLFVVCHLVRFLSWSMLFLFLAGLVAVFPAVEGYLRGGP